MSASLPPEQNRLLGHAAECDGIEEYDNPLPTWWLGILYGTIVFAIVYTADYHFVNHRSQAGEYDAEVAAAAITWPTPDASALANVPLTPELIAAGKAVFESNCIGCHGTDLHGGVGPNLTDLDWIHGGTLENITKTITEGVPAKGMITWGPILGPEKISQVSAYIHNAGGGN
jgi:cytochrome c oxidase cbb3-type subunit 3